ncbi:E3 ubiquitin-protein ligase RHA2A [Lasiodiplodia hormozganensis]|uniref:E3 ubiquitin-protein ligase RHA2A n=1 Tax=Lasiodiplodia hormozganensis TaxID=869390 RepID=A0AA40CWF8_9PEZI|nr:E3 ubiquitin-protein ligase RHA2A [Lasiodiplodia hormozganensis]
MPDASPAGSRAIMIVLPTIFAIILVILIATTAIILPRLPKNSDIEKAECRKKRMLNLERACKSQIFKDWCSKHETEHPEYKSEHPVCVICLEEIEDKAHVRGLGCHHVFHQGCLDDWFDRFNEFCPLCHRPILPSVCSKSKKSTRSSMDTAHDAAAMMV